MDTWSHQLFDSESDPHRRVFETDRVRFVRLRRPILRQKQRYLLPNGLHLARSKHLMQARKLPDKTVELSNSIWLNQGRRIIFGEATCP